MHFMLDYGFVAYHRKFMRCLPYSLSVPLGTTYMSM